jgi:hypothetical protein
MTGVVDFEMLRTLISSGSSGVVDILADLERARAEIAWNMGRPAAPPVLERVSAETLAEMLDFKDARQVTRLAREGILPGEKVGKGWRFHPEEVRKALETKRGGR